MQKEKRLLLLASFISGGLLLALVYHGWLMGGVLGRGYPWNGFLFNPQWLFSDFYELAAINTHLNPYFEPAVLKSAYPPAANIIGYFFSLAGALGSDIYLLVFAGFFGFIGLRNFDCGNKLRAGLYTLFILFAAYPVIYLADRGNLELLAFIPFYFFIDNYRREKYQSAALFLGLSAALKIMPMFFITLFLLDKKWREALFCVASAAAVSLLCALFLHGGISATVTGMLANFAAYKSDYLYTGYGLVFGNSLYGGLHALLCAVFGRNPGTPFGWLLAVYPFVAAACAIVLVWRAKLQGEFWEKIFLLTVALVVLPSVSADYRLIYFLAPLLLFVNSKKPEPRELLYCLLFGFILIPKHYLYFAAPEISSSAVLTPLAVLVFAFFLAKEKPQAQ